MLVSALFLLAQFRQPDRTNPPLRSDVDAPPEVAEILRRACYDCHSHETDWRWYSYIAPVSWWVADHVEHGRSDLNFSDWPMFDFEAIEQSMSDIDEQLEQDEMPLKSYLIMHPEARLTEDEKTIIRRWTQGER